MTPREGGDIDYKNCSDEETQSPKLVGLTIMDYLLVYGTIFALTIYLILKRRSRFSLDDIRGPRSNSFLHGSIHELFQSKPGELDLRYQEEYGGVARVKGPLGQNFLWLSDPKALQYVLQTGSYTFSKPTERTALSELLGDRGIAAVEGDVHKRHRKVMLPAFGMPESKALFPTFTRCAESITTRWKDALFDSPDQSRVFNVVNWLGRATLDAIGEAAFDVKFNAIENQDDEFIKSYQRLMLGSFSSPSTSTIFFRCLSRFVPPRLLSFIYSQLPRYNLAHENRRLSHKISKKMLTEKSEALSKGAGHHDVMTLLIKANKSENEKTKLSNEEIIAQMRTILLAGHETTSNTLGWGFLELAKRPDIQTRLRKEIHAMQANLQSRGRSQLSPTDLDAMPYLQAFMKETLRLRPVVYHIQRAAGKDVVIPLSKPVVTVSEKEVQEIFVPKGTRIIMSILAYNRDKTVWGEDAHEFNPDRWLIEDEKRNTAVGVYSNLLTFAGGVRGCIGWRFAIYEMQAFLVELVSQFEFSLAEETRKVRTEANVIMTPTVDGKTASMPLRVSLVERG